MSEQQPYILYVDDSEDDIIMAKRAFRKSNLKNNIVTLTDGQECLDYLFGEGEYENQQHDMPEVILLDLNMPRLDGFQTLEQLRANDKTSQLPVVVLTTSDSNDDISRSYELGANSYITKSIQTEDFCQAIISLEIYWTVYNKKKPK